MKTRRWLGVTMAGVAMTALVARAGAQGTEIDLPRPGSILAAEVTGEVVMSNGDQRRPLKADERVRIGATITTGRRSLVTLAFSNGVALQLGSESELELEEFGQEPFSGSVKLLELKEEPTRSRTRIRLVRGELTASVKPLKVSRGSSFVLTTTAGNLRTGDGVIRAMVRMHELGLGVATFAVTAGAAEFEAVGSTAFVPILAGRKLAFAIEVDQNGVVKVGEMPKETPEGKEPGPSEGAKR